MDYKQRRLIERIRSGISGRVHDERVQSRLQIGSSLALGIGLLVSASIFFGLFDSPQPSFSDLVYQPRAPGPTVSIVAIDDRSLAAIGPWPWPRASLARLVDALARYHPTVIAVDLLLPEAASDDQALSQAFGSAAHVVLPIEGVQATSSTPTHPFLRFGSALKPDPLLLTSNSTLGHNMIRPDSDGVVRRVAVAIDAAGTRYPALGIAAIEAAQSRSLGSAVENGQISFGSTSLPVDPLGRMHLNFFDWNADHVFSAIDVIQGHANAGALQGRIVLIGAMGPSAPQAFQLPLSLGNRSASEVEIQADLIESIVSNRMLVEQDRLSQVLVIFLIALLAGATLPHVRLMTTVGLTLLYLAMYLSYTIRKFDEGVIVQPLYPVLALILTTVSVMVYRYFSEERQRSRLQQLFRRYVAPEAIDQVMDNVENGSLHMHGSRRNVSVLYVDMRELGVLAESLTPEVAVDVLNQYVTLVVGAVFRQGGTLSKHTGDTIVAVWNVPLRQADHAQRAVRAALEVKHEVEARRRSQAKGMSIQVGIGVGTGSAVAGRIGASARSEYTILGEVLVMAERMAMKMDRGVFVDLATREEIAGEFDTREVNPVRLRRKTDPALVWEISEPIDLSEETAAASEGLEQTPG